MTGARRPGRGVAAIGSGLVLAAAASVPAVADEPASLALGEDSRIDPGAFRVTVFASGLPYPTAMIPMEDGSLLVAVNEPRKGGFIASRGKLLRLRDADGDGRADASVPVGIVAPLNGAGPPVYRDLPNAIVQMRRYGDLLFVSSRARTVSHISVLRDPGSPDEPLELLGTLEFEFPKGHLHDTYALAVREGDAVDSVELYFNVGSALNAATDLTPIEVTGLVDDQLRPESIHRLTLLDDGSRVEIIDHRLIATGLRNAAGMAFHPETGDLYLQDNGMDGELDPSEPINADELNVIRAPELGSEIPDFGYPDDYVEYRSGRRVGTGARPPLVAFLPRDGSESEGPAEIAFAPPGFPEPLRDGLFVGFHGNYSEGGLENEENPLLYVDLDTSDYFEFVPNALATVGHLDNLVATDDSLFIADLSPTGKLTSRGSDGVIYQVKVVD